MAHREPEELSLESLKALLENLPESSATRRQNSPLAVDTIGLQLALLFDLTHQIALGKKTLPDEKKMAKKVYKGFTTETYDEQLATAKQAAAIYEAKRLERIRKKEAKAKG